MTAKELAVRAVQTMMKKFEAKDLPPVRKFHYHQGVFLSGVMHTYHLTGEEKFYSYTKEWVDSTLGEDGYPVDMDKNALDDMQPGILLYEIYERTGDERYKKILDKIIGHIDVWPKTAEGGFYHKVGGKAENMWLDGMYMGGPVTVEYAVKYGRPDLIPLVHKQMSLMRDNIREPENGLFYHAYDCTRTAAWANPATGCAPHFWGRAMGWYAVAMFEIADLLPETHELRDDFIKTGKDLISALLPYRDEKTGLWYQVIDRGDDPKNWHEISCSSLFLYAMCLAAKIGVIDRDELYPIAKKTFEGIVGTLALSDDGYVGVRGVCIGTGVGDYEHYLNRPTSENDLHGVGAFLLAATEYSKLYE